MTGSIGSSIPSSLEARARDKNDEQSKQSALFTGKKIEQDDKKTLEKIEDIHVLNKIESKEEEKKHVFVGSNVVPGSTLTKADPEIHSLRKHIREYEEESGTRRKTYELCCIDIFSSLAKGIEEFDGEEGPEATEQPGSGLLLL